jgi:hypothetical protein
LASRSTIEQRISLQGGKEILEQLRQLGAAGEQAFKQIEDAANRAGTIDGRVGKTIAQLKDAFKELGAAGGRLRTEFAAVGRSTVNVGTAFRNAAIRTTAIVGAVTVAAGSLVLFTKSAADAADQAGKTAQSLGLTVEQFGRLKFAANQSGLDDSQFGRAISQINELVGEATTGNEKFIKLLINTGVQLRDTSGNIRGANEVLGDIAQRFSEMPDGVRKSALAIELFGDKLGPQLIPFLNQGRDGIRALGDEAARLGLIFTNEQVKNAEEFNDALSALGAAVAGAKNQIALLFAPVLTTGINELIDLIAENREAVQEYAETIVNKAIPVVEDFFRLLSGEGAFETDFFQKAVDSVVFFAQSLEGAVTNIIIPAIQLIIAQFDLLASAINSVFGSDLTGVQIFISVLVLQLTGALNVVFAALGLVISSVRFLIAAFGLAGPAIKVAVGLFNLLRLAGLAVVASISGLLSIPGAVVAVVAVAIAAIIIFWDEIVAASKVAIDAIIAAVRPIAEGIRAAFNGVAEIGAAAWNKVAEAALAFWDRVKQAANSAVEFIERQIENLVGVWNRVADAAIGIWEGFKNAASDAIDFVSRQIDRLKAAVDRLRAAIRRIRSSDSSSSSGGSSTDDAAPAPGFAKGGKIRGRGTGTSDSILAWLSDGEYVIKARAVRHYGNEVLSAINSMRLPKNSFRKFATGGPVSVPAFQSVRAAFNEASLPSLGASAPSGESLGWTGRLLGALLTPTLDTLRTLPRFAAGGPVSITNVLDGLGDSMNLRLPAFANGGMATGAGGRPVNINIGGQEFGPMYAEEAVVENLSRYASQRKVTSLGRKPGWYGR